MNEERQRLQAQASQLPEACRAVFLLCEVHAMATAEAARQLQLPEAAVRARLAHARGLVRGWLASHHDTRMGEAFAFDGARCDRITARTLERAKAEGLY